MRSMMRAVLVAVAVSVAVPSMAQTKSPAPVVLPFNKVPAKVRTSLKKAYPSAKVTTAEQIGTGKNAVYHFVMTGARATDVKISADGKILGGPAKK